jgi:hypothetical protein
MATTRKARTVSVPSPSSSAAVVTLAKLTRYTRAPQGKRMGEGSDDYKKGWEVRFVVDSQKDVAGVKKALASLGFNAGKPFAKASRIAVPVYGRAVVEFCAKHMK